MRIYYDFEFIEDGSTIDVISVGMVSDDGREYYAVSADMPADRIQHHQWLMAHVVPHLPLVRGEVTKSTFGDNSAPHGRFTLDTGDIRVKPLWVIRNEVRAFLDATPVVELWGYYAAYDHVALAQLFGPMVSRPQSMPMFTHDVMQALDVHGLAEADLPAPPGDQHNALSDARWTRDAVAWIDRRVAERDEQ